MHWKRLDRIALYHFCLIYLSKDIDEKYEGIYINFMIEFSHLVAHWSHSGLGESVPNHATPTLDVGMQMLQSLEASGDLDTPMSGDSESFR